MKKNMLQPLKDRVFIYSSLKAWPSLSRAVVMRTIEKVENMVEKKKISGSISVHFVGSRRIKQLNNAYRNKNRVTDVLSFAYEDAKEFALFSGMEKSLGDIFMCVPVIASQAKFRNISFKEEAVRMLTHGMLHLFGYDHVKLTDEKKMFDLQERIVRKIL